MKQSKILIPTLKEVPNDAETISHKLMLRAGYIRPVAAGVYSYLPLCFMVLKKINRIIENEMSKIDAVEMRMPSIVPAELWKKSGRYETYGPNLFKFHDRHNRDFILGPTHEETFTDLIRNTIKSYKSLPLILYQIQVKYRDEDRPRYGLLRNREFIMKDAYSFASNEDDLNDAYNKMKNAYIHIFKECGLNFKIIIGDAGAMGGNDSMEFSAISSIGEDTIAYSNASSYAANLEMATSIVFNDKKQNDDLKLIDKIFTPNVKTINDLSLYLKTDKSKIIKSILYISDDKPILVLIRGDYDINEIKLKNYLNSNVLRMALKDEVKKYLGCNVGFVGPININVKIPIIADKTIKNLHNVYSGSNINNYHFKNVNPERDFVPNEYVDIRIVHEGEKSPDGKGKLIFTKGIEIGHIFKLGTHYSKIMGANFLDKKGISKPIIMGCYGIGVSRLLSAIVEQTADEKGLVWPNNIAPFNIHVIPINVKDESQFKEAKYLTNYLEKNGYSVLLDDRNERAGVKFADSDLIGIPLRIIIGKKINDGIFEIKIRKSGKKILTNKNDILNIINNIFSTEDI